jgi:paired amphipathic helix protein Sin3a
LACSGRDELCRSVLNDEWVSHPTWASEEAGFIAHKKNSFEEALHKSEEERHEYHVQLEGLARTIAVIEPINSRIEEMTNEERSNFRLKPDLGGSSKSIYHRTLKKVYGREAGMEVIQALQECPSVAVPVVLGRLKQKDEEWRRMQREWNKTWREVDAKNFYKSLDHQGVTFKSNDKKVVTAKHFVGNIESVKADQAEIRAQQGRPPFATPLPGHQLEFPFKDTSVLQDSLKLVYSFLDHSHAHYSAQERRAVEGWLRSFIPLLCMCPAADFNAGYGPPNDSRDEEMDQALDGPRNEHGVASASGRGNAVAAGDLRKQLLKSSQEKSAGTDSMDTSSTPQSGGATPRAALPDTSLGDRSAPPGVDSPDQWICDASANQGPFISGDEASKRKPFFANTTFYTVFCLLQVRLTIVCA